MNRSRYSSVVLLITVGAVLFGVFCACTTQQGGRSALPPQRQLRLLKTARFPSQLGIQIDEKEGPLAFENVHAVSIGTKSSSAFTPRAQMDLASFPLVEISLNGHHCTAALSTALPISLTDYQNALVTDIRPLAQATTPQLETGEWDLVPRRTRAPFTQIHDFLAISRSLQMGSLIMYNVPIGVIDDTRGLAILPQVPQLSIDVVLGDDFMRTFSRITFDFPARSITMASRGIHRPEPENLVAAGLFDESFHLPVMRAMFDGKGPFPVVLDTAGDFGIVIPSHLAGNLGLLDGENGHIRFGTEAMSVSCSALGRRTLDLSGFEIPDVNGLAVEVSEQDLPYAMLGNDVLRQFIVTIDYGEKRVYFEASDLPTM